jgi:hypothetical protein
MCDFYDQIVKEARGIILDMESLEVVCWPFNKFGNWQEGYADKIDWDSAKVQEKLDGSIMKLWFNKRSGEWQWSTNGVINADNASFKEINFGSLVKKAVNYDTLQFQLGSLDKTHTYIFELVSYNDHVVSYPGIKLFLIGERDLVTGEEVTPYINGIDRPREYALKDFDSCIKYLSTMNKENLEHEGFVVVDKNYHRIKMKTEEYILGHRMKSKDSIKAKDAIELILSEDKGNYKELCKNLSLKKQIKYYEYKLAEIEFDAQELINFSRCFYEEMSCDRAALAKKIQNEPLKAFAFKSIGNNLSAIDIMKQHSVNTFVKLIEGAYKDD